MQFLLEGTTPLFWKQITAQPTSIYNKSNNQAAGAAISQLLVAFIDQLPGTLVHIYMNNVLQATAKVLDNTGLVYARFSLPLTQNQDSIEISIKEASTNITIVTETFATSLISYLFEAQALSMADTEINIGQLSQDHSIEGVNPALLENKYGVFTGLRRRSDQTLDTYRSQTSCLWKAYQYASMEQGLISVIGCVLGIGVGLQIQIISAKDSLRGIIFDDPQYWFTSGDPYSEIPPHPLSQLDSDSPHFYIAEIEAAYRPSGYTTTPQVVLGPYPGTWNTDWDEDTVKQLITHTTQGLGNEVFITIGAGIGIDESDAIIAITGESILRRSGTGEDNPDQVGNINIASTIVVTQAYIGGILKTASIDLPIEDADFTVDVFTGQIIWDSGSSKIPDTNTLYKINYEFRLDEALKTVIKRIKPIHKNVIILYSNVTSKLPYAVEA